jgi:hypothetical protein
MKRSLLTPIAVTFAVLSLAGTAQAAVQNAIPLNQKGAANGVATLNSSSLLVQELRPEAVSEAKLAKALVELIAGKATKTEAEGKLAKAENLKDLASAATARANLGLGTAAVEASSAFDAAGTSAAGVKVEKERAEAAEILKAPLASPILTGTPKAPTAAAKTNTEQLASTAFTQTAKTEAETADKAAAAAEVKTEKERAETAEALKAPLASPTLTGTPAGPTAAAKTNTTQLATTAFVQSAFSELEALTLLKTEKGAINGVAELTASGKLAETELPPCVLPDKVKALGKLTGATAELNLEEGTLFTATLEHEVTFKVTHAPSGCADGVELITTENATGGFKWSAEGLAWVNGEPALVTTKSTSSAISITAYESLLKGFGGIEGKEGPAGPEGKTGKEGPEGTSGHPLPIWLPSGAPRPEPEAAGAIGEADLAVCMRMMPFYKTGTLKEIAIFGGTKSNKTRLAILDIGVKTEKKYTVLWEGAEEEMGTNAWLVQKPELAVTAGVEDLACVMNAGTTQTYGYGLKTSANVAATELPSAFLPVAGKSLPKIAGKHKYGSLSFGAAGASLTEAELEQSTTVIYTFIGRIE